MSRSGKHYMPRPDGDFGAWANHYYEAVEKFWSVQGLDPADLLDLKSALLAWNAAFPAHIAAQQQAEAARQSKDAARAALERRVRPITNFVQTYFGTANTDRAAMGIALRDPGATPAAPPATRPQALVNAGQRLTHHLRLVDDATPTRRAKPAGVQRGEVFLALSAPGSPAPADPALYRYIGSITRGGTVLSFEARQGGMQAHYLSRWVSTAGAPGPWSAIASATIAA